MGLLTPENSILVQGSFGGHPLLAPSSLDD
jgi:hypothetical protein